MTASQQEVPPAIFGQRLRRERKRRGWNMRDLSTKCGASINSISRTERGYDLMLSNAIAITAALGVSLDVMLTEPECAQCDDMPPAGFTCQACGREGTV